MKAKLVEFAYPSSTRATKAGFGDTGCWFVILYPTMSACTTKEKPLAYYADKQGAIGHADMLPEPYHNWHNKYR